MKSFRTLAFRDCFRKIPASVQVTARKNYRLWVEDASHPSLSFKKVGADPPVWSVRVGIGWRALGVLKGDAIVWFWIGSHAQYDRMVNPRQ